MSAKKSTKTKGTKAASATKTAAKKSKADAAAKEAKAPKARKPKNDGKLTALDAAVKVLVEKDQWMTVKELIEAMAENGYWTSPNGQTPDRTLYSAIAREINTKGKNARFVKGERGKFAVTNAAKRKDGAA